MSASGQGAATRPLLAARRLGKRFGAVVAAEDIDIEVPAGQRLSVIGSNGAGKTTFVNMVTGYLKPDAGRIELDGEDITRLSHPAIARRGICRSFQIPQLCLELTLRENLLVAVAAAEGRPSLWRAADGARQRERADALMHRFGLEADADRSVLELAGGVRKLVDIAMALARRPRLLLLDEPTSGVSADEKFPAMQRVMDALAGEAATVVFVEHDMDIVAGFSDRVIAFYSGRVIADGTPADVLADADVQRHVTGGAGAGGTR
ncbi:MAG: ATP-binding cassette domain-containing protein [Rubrivivax sp.]|nr:ATP-binding cassette domain-containing protein [Rubrivivax sp.]